jgi:hypothetical protein
LFVRLGFLQKIPEINNCREEGFIWLMLAEVLVHVCGPVVAQHHGLGRAKLLVTRKEGMKTFSFFSFYSM